jgi:hypothetical protein
MYLFNVYYVTCDHRRKKCKRKFDTFSVEGSYFCGQEIRKCDHTLSPVGHVEWTGSYVISPFFSAVLATWRDRK